MARRRKTCIIPTGIPKVGKKWAKHLEAYKETVKKSEEIERLKGECWLPEWFVEMLGLGADDGYCINLDDATADGKIQMLSVLKWDNEFKEWRQIQYCKLTRIEDKWLLQESDGDE